MLARFNDRLTRVLCRGRTANSKTSRKFSRSPKRVRSTFGTQGDVSFYLFTCFILFFPKVTVSRGRHVGFANVA